MDEGVMFGALCAVVFLFVFGIEFIRAQRGTIKQLRREQYVNASTWAVFLCLTASCYVRNPAEKDPSIFLTVGAGLNLFALCLLYLAPRRDGEVSDRTVDLAGSQDARAPGEFGLLMTVALALRIGVTMRWNGYLPSDQTGDGCIQFMEGVTGAIVLYATLFREKSVSLKAIARTFFGVGISGVTAMYVYGGLDHNIFADRIYAVSIYTELVAWAFMLFFVVNQAQEYANSMYLLPSFVAACSQLYFWLAVLQEHSANVEKAQGWFGLTLVGVHFSQVLIFATMASLSLKNVELPTCVPGGIMKSESWNVMTKMV